jgi:DNA-binding response OmpR family regulator
VLKKPFQGSSLQQQVTALLSGRTEAGDSQEDAEAVQTLETPRGAVSAAGISSGTKAYRITEEQLQGFRKTVARVRELEKLLAEERAYAAHLVKRLIEIQRLVQDTIAVADKSHDPAR